MIQKTDIAALVMEKIQGTDQFLVDIKLSPNKLAVFVDKPEGISLDECTSLTRFLLEKLEPEGFLETHEVEVSSPGMDSPLLVPQQYQRRLGRELRVIDRNGREIKGVLEDAGAEEISLKEVRTVRENKKKITTEAVHRIPYADIKEAKLIFNFKFK